LSSGNPQSINIFHVVFGMLKQDGGTPALLRRRFCLCRANADVFDSVLDAEELMSVSN
jgi:hypothetical protein